MADSDGEFVADDGSSDDYGDHKVSRNGPDGDDDSDAPINRHGTRGAKRKRKEAAWEVVKRSWETVTEAEDGRLTGLDVIEAEKRRRLLLRGDTTPLQRGIIRHLVLVLDLSFAMVAKDYLPSLYWAEVRAAAEFVKEFFEQNPISQLAIVGMKNGVAERISEMGGSPPEHLRNLEALLGFEDKHQPAGNPSLQNALEMCRGSLFHTPTHGTREVVLIFGALFSSDPGDIHDTITSLIADRIRVSIISLGAAIAICQEICERTNPGGDGSAYAVPLNEPHFRDLLLAHTTPPVTRDVEAANASLLMMGFPSRAVESGGPPGKTEPADGKGTATTLQSGPSFCACHGDLTREGYRCTRCSTKVCRLPAECPACGLTLILSTHLARSYHHLFPLRNWVEVPWADAAQSEACYACLTPFPEVPRDRAKTRIKVKGKEKDTGGGGDKGKEKEGGGGQTNGAKADEPTKLKGVSESGRYACEVCGNHFCIDCDVFCHEVVHNCPGCQSDTRGQATAANGEKGANGEEPMVID